MDIFDDRWTVSARAMKKIRRGLAKVIANTSRLGKGGNGKVEPIAPQTKPKYTKAQYLVKLQKAVLKSVSTRFSVKGWVGSDVRNMCSRTVHAVALGASDSELISAFAKAYK